MGSSLERLTSIHALCSPCEEAPYSLNEAVLVFASKPRGKIIMMRDADVNNGMFVRLIRDSCLEWNTEITLIKDKYIFPVHELGVAQGGWHLTGQLIVRTHQAHLHVCSQTLDGNRCHSTWPSHLIRAQRYVWTAKALSLAPPPQANMQWA